MITAVLPFKIADNSFWKSSEGVKYINEFISTCMQISEIDHVVVVSLDSGFLCLSEKHNVNFEIYDITLENTDSYTLNQSINIALCSDKYLKNDDDVLLLIDHRNLFLSKKK